MINIEVIRLNAAKFRGYVAVHQEDDPRGCDVWMGGKDRDGYGSFQFRHRGRKHKVRAHRVAHMLATGKTPQVLRHECDNPACVRPEHLVDGTHADNTADKMNRGCEARGERHGHAKLTEDQVREILVSEGRSPVVAAKFGVDSSLVRRIRRRCIWRKVATTTVVGEIVVMPGVEPGPAPSMQGTLSAELHDRDFVGGGRVERPTSAVTLEPRRCSAIELPARDPT